METAEQEGMLEALHEDPDQDFTSCPREEDDQEDLDPPYELLGEPLASSFDGEANVESDIAGATGHEDREFESERLASLRLPDEDRERSTQRLQHVSSPGSRVADSRSGTGGEDVAGQLQQLISVVGVLASRLERVEAASSDTSSGSQWRPRSDTVNLGYVDHGALDRWYNHQVHRLYRDGSFRIRGLTVRQVGSDSSGTGWALGVLEDLDGDNHLIPRCRLCSVMRQVRFQCQARLQVPRQTKVRFQVSRQVTPSALCKVRCQVPHKALGQVPGAAQSLGQVPGAAQSPGQVLGAAQSPGQARGQVPGDAQSSGQALGQVPSAAQGPGQALGQVPGAARSPGQALGQMPSHACSALQRSHARPGSGAGSVDRP